MAQHYLTYLEKPILIAHRGNIDGVNKNRENSPEYIDEALKLGFDVELDLWFLQNTWWLGHDKPQYQIPLKWLYDRKKGLLPDKTRNMLWIHCKTLDTIEAVQRNNEMLKTSSNDSEYKSNWMNYFFHDGDLMTLTSQNIMWVHPKVELVPIGCAWVHPFDKQIDFTNFNWGRARYVCADNVNEIKELFTK